MEGSVGSFRLLERLGQGGMGVVYRARHEPSGEPAALKMVRAPHAATLQSLRREIYALAQLRHPGIVRILGEGVHEGMPWYAMELLEGMTLRYWRTAFSPAPELASSASTPSAVAPPRWTRTWAQHETQEIGGSPPAAPAALEPLERLTPVELRFVLGLARRLCFALAYLHGEGLVHRDLKPENVLIRPGGLPVIVDFGLASRSGVEPNREALEVAGDVTGTVSYMAPEQGRGETVDARADLYSLGCILYELCTGRLPFTGATQMQVMLQHFEAEPLPPSVLAPWIGPELERLILRLLEKEPRARFGYADDVAAELGRLGADVEPPAGAPPARAYLYRPSLSGRREALDGLGERLAALRSGRGGLVLIGGESGVGKTRLLVELSRRATREGLRVLTGECLPPVSPSDAASGSAPLQAFRKSLQSIADLCREQGARETELLLGGRSGVLAAYEPALAGLPGLESQAPPAELTPRESLLRLHGCLLETLTARRAPLLLLLDDLQWSDELSLGALDFFAQGRALEAHPLLLVGVYRSEETSPGLRRLLEAPGVGALRLERLDGVAVGRLVAEMLGLAETPRTFASFLLRQSEGNPFFVAEYLRVAVERRLLYRDEAGHWQVAEPGSEAATESTYAELPLPRSLLELVGGRLARLSPAARRLVDSLSVLGREAGPDLLRDVSGLRGASALEATLEALSRQVLEADDVGTRHAVSLRFAHDKLREVAYAGLAAEARRELHLAAAESLEARIPSAEEPPFAALARHWEQGGRPDRARPHCLAAARREKDRYAWREAEAHYRAYLRLADAPAPETVQARNELGQGCLWWQGRMSDALAEHQAALLEARSLGHLELELDCLLFVGRTYWGLHRAPEAEAGIAELLERLRGLDRPFHLKKALELRANVDLEQGRQASAVGLYEQVLELARRLGSRAEEGLALSNLANALVFQGRLAEARALYEQSLQIRRQRGEFRGEGHVLTNLANLDKEEGRLESALGLYQKALELRRRVGDRRGVAATLGNLGSVHQDLGQLERARECFEQALGMMRELGERLGEAYTLGNLSMVWHELGRPLESAALLDQALVRLRALGDRRAVGIFLCGAAMTARRFGGELDRADALAEEAEALLGQVGDRLHLRLVHCERGHAALARGLPAAEHLRLAGTDASELRAESEVGRALGRLRRAIAASEAGLPLTHGELLDDLPEGVRRWLRGLEPPAPLPTSP